MLTDVKIRNTKPSDKPLKLTDSNGLYLEVRPTGAKLWRYRYRIAGRENLFAIGEYFTDKRPGHVSLEDARLERDKARALVKQGLHPSHQRQAARIAAHAENGNTFEGVAREWIAKKKSTWTPYYLRQVDYSMESNVFPFIGNLPIRNVSAADILEILRRCENRGAESVAMLVRQWASNVFRYAVATLRADSDPAAALKGAIHRPKVQHHKPLTRDQIGVFLGLLDAHGGQLTTQIALRLMLLTFVRTVELRCAEWSEIDFEEREWRIPADRMKMRVPHLVPLSKQAMELLRALHKITGNGRFLFPNTRTPGGCMSPTTLNRSLERMGFCGKESGIGFSAHGFRSTASTLLNEMNFRADLIEMQLAHQDANAVRRAYNRAEWVEERRHMMQAWADFVDGVASGSNVLPLRKGAA